MEHSRASMVRKISMENGSIVQRYTICSKNSTFCGIGDVKRGRYLDI
jgi:hypothetical protein